MSISDLVFKNDEKAIFGLRELYSRYGYLKYKVSKFEEYDLYAKNKSFLISENILTFTDTDGRLMALKPDVTLSIIKNIGNGQQGTHKLYYNENVYRTSASADGFREIMQTGLECIGDIDLCSMSEVITLAQKSLDTISEDNILDLSHMGFVLGLIEELGILDADADTLVGYIGHRNIPAIKAFCADRKVGEEDTAKICKMTELYAPMKEALAMVSDMVSGDRMRAAFDELCGICRMLDASGDINRIYLDFSTVNDMNYYNGVIFKGFVNGIPDSILSGGRYDSLMAKMGKKAGAIGFAVYLDMLERLPCEERRYDVDTVLLYDDADVESVMKIADKLRAEGKSIKTERGTVGTLRYRQLLKVTKEGVDILETND